MERRMDGPRREGQQLALLVLGREAIGLLEPAVDGRILAGDDAPLGEEAVRESGPRCSFDHLLEAAPRNHLGVNVDAVLDEDAKDAFVRAVARDAPRDAVRLDDPQRQRMSRPHRFRPQAPHLDDGEHITVRHDPLGELGEGGLEAGEFCSVVIAGHGWRLVMVCKPRGILVSIRASMPRFSQVQLMTILV
jgi:hypothetical protein